MPAFGADARKAPSPRAWMGLFFLVLEAVERADLLDEGDMAGAETWHRILKAIERLQARHPAEGEKVH
jgi:hypothetical protein